MYGEAATLLLATVVTGAILVPVMELWRADLSVPFSYSWDANFNAMLIKGILHGAWYMNNNLGAPFGQQLYDYAIGGDDLHFLLLKALGLASHDPAVVMNLFFLLSFPLSALTAYVVFRWARLSRLVACACAILYALTPYHFVRGERHLFLAADYGVPLGAYLVLATWSGEPLFARRPARSALLTFVTRRSLATLVACAVVASAGTFYYAAFTFILVVAGALARAVALRAYRPLLAGATLGALIAVVAAINLAPTILYTARHGRNYVAAQRRPGESDRGSLKLAEMIFPVARHRFQPFARLSQEYAWSASPPNVGGQEHPALGSVATIGFLWLMVVLILSCLRVKNRSLELIERFRPIAGATGVALLLGITGGFSAVIAYLITPQLRGWNRISIFIAFFSLLAVGLLLERLRLVLSSTLVRRAAFVVALSGLVALGALDQTTKADVPPYRQLAATYGSDAGIVRAMERRFPPGSMVFELPYVPFPEWPAVHAMLDYEMVRPYLHSTNLRWSYGAMRGRTQDWQRFLVEKPLADVVAGIAAAGFSAIFVDRNGYTAQEAYSLDRALRHMLRVRPLVSRDRRLVVFDLRPYLVRLRARYSTGELAAVRTATLTPPQVEAGRGVWPGEEWNLAGHHSWWLTSRWGTLDLHEPARAETVTFFGSFRGAPNQLRPPFRVTVAWPGGAVSRFLVTRRGASFSRRLALRPGNNIVNVTTKAPPIFAPWDSRTLYLQLLDARFTEPAFAPFDTVVGGRDARSCSRNTTTASSEGDARVRRL